MSAYYDVDRVPDAPSKPYAARNVENGEVAEPGHANRAMHEDLELIEALLGGTCAMREAGREYLPQHPYEADRAYENRLAVTYLDNYTLRTLNTLVGKAFKEPPRPGADAPKPIEEFLDDVDDAGTGLVPFAREWFRRGVEQAVSHVLVDMPAAAPRPDGQPRTLADDARDGMRPTWRIITAKDMLDLQVGKVTVAGQTKVRPTLVRYRDDEVRQKGRFGCELVRRVKVLRHEGAMVTWEAWELQTGPRGGKPKWVEVTPPTALGLPFIPLVTFYTDRTGVGEGRPPLADLADMNKRHWQSTSDQINALTVARFPILAASGVREAEGDGRAGEIVVGPNKFLTTPDPQSKVYYVETTGASIDKGKDELERLEGAMASYGAEFMKKGAQGPETASGRILDEGAAISPLQAWGLDFKDCLELAGWYTAQWMKLGDGIEVPFEFEVEAEIDPTGQDMQTLDAARSRKDISREAWVSEAQRRGILSDDYDPEEDMQKLQDEPPPPGGGLDGMFPAPGGAKPQPGAKQDPKAAQQPDPKAQEKQPPAPTE